MQRRRTPNLITVVVWSKGHALEGQEVPLGCANGFQGIDWMTFKPFEAEVLAEEYAKTPGLYEQNLGDVLRRALSAAKATEPGQAVAS